jgi:hypothetical protein
MQLIQTITLASPAIQIEFTSIPQDATDLLVLFSCRNVNVTNIVQMKINNSSTGVYSYRSLASSGSTPTASTTSNAFEVRWSGTVASNQTSNTFSNNAISFANYRSNKTKSFVIECTAENNAATAFMSFIRGESSTTAAISSIQLYGFGDNFATGTTASLYKITKA